MSNYPSTIVYRCDFVRQGEKQKTKKEAAKLQGVA